MMGAATRLWTCDKCGDTTTCMAESHPPAWRTVEAKYLGGDGGDYRAHWCGKCVQIRLKPKFANPRC